MSNWYQRITSALREAERYHISDNSTLCSGSRASQGLPIPLPFERPPDNVPPRRVRMTSKAPQSKSKIGQSPVDGQSGSGEGFYDPGMLLRTAKSYMECPVCVEWLTKPIYQCSNGHIVCKTCIEILSICGQCRVSLSGSKIRNVALEQMIESMEIQCPNHSDGCRFKACGEQLESHLKVCDFRPIELCAKFLGFSKCTVKVNSLVAPFHLQESHQAVAVNNSKFSLNLIGPSTVFETLGQGAVWGPILVNSPVDTDIVLKCVILPNGYLSLTGYLLGCSKEDLKKYRVKFQIDTEASRVEWTGNLLSVLHHNPSNEISNVNTFLVSIFFLKEFIKPFNGILPYSSHVDVRKLKVKVAFWKLSHNDKPYKECFMNLETGEKEPIQKLRLHSKPYTGSNESGPSTSQA